MNHIGTSKQRVSAQESEDADVKSLEKVFLSVIILAKNEEQFIERCINSVAWADEKLILDSGSTDKTREIVLSLGATVYQQEWLGWSAQRTKAISLAKHDWVFVLEADEIVTPELARSIQTVMSKPRDDRNGYSVDRRDDFHGMLMPNIRRAKKNLNFIRIFNRRYSSYDPTMKIHEEVCCPGKAIMLSGVLMHWRGWTIDEQISALNRVATTEAKVLYEQKRQVNGVMLLIRPILRFLWCYLAKGTFRSGTRGLNYALVRAVSEYVRYAKFWEMQNVVHSIHPAAYQSDAASKQD